MILILNFKRSAKFKRPVPKGGHTNRQGCTSKGLACKILNPYKYNYHIIMCCQISGLPINRQPKKIAILFGQPFNFNRLIFRLLGACFFCAFDCKTYSITSRAFRYSINFSGSVAISLGMLGPSIDCKISFISAGICSSVVRTKPAAEISRKTPFLKRTV